MEPFEYAHPASVKDAVALLGPHWADAEILAGGTDLLSRMKDYVAQPKRVVSISGLSDLQGIQVNPKETSIGALVTLEELATNDHIQSVFRGLAQASGAIAGPQTRTMATVGGNLCQRPYCWYFRGGFGLLALDASGKSLVPNGDNRYHAILGNAGPAYFVSPSSLAPALIALGASIHLTGRGGLRAIQLTDFFMTPKTANARENILLPSEVVTHITIPAASRTLRSGSAEIRERTVIDWALVCASVALNMNGSTVRSARIVIGHVAPVPWQATMADQMLIGKTITDDVAAKAGEAAVHGAKPLSGNGYKVQLARVAVKRALLAAAAQQQGA